ncbi:MAG: EamA family transporter [Candidatus Eremiobacteraeota bacterium]|nr:EamA family transporter [Candidatus Eremiobacteraeota bacterium]MBV9408300.1 EamA family transporter [Candidatus Eremiobacteraeota bacterium]
MVGGGLAALGLTLAAGTSLSNSFADVALKKAVHAVSVGAVYFWSRVVAAVGITAVFAWWVLSGHVDAMRDVGPLFGMAFLHLPPLATFLVYLLFETLILCGAALLQGRAYQVAPISLCVPFISFTPVFLILTGWVFLGELPQLAKLVGVLIIVLGSLGMHRQLFATSLFAPFQAIVKEKGSRYMLIVAFALAVTNPIDKILVLMTDPITDAFAYSVTAAIMFAFLTFPERKAILPAMRANGPWIVLLGVLQLVVLVLQFASIQAIAVVITISIKRAGVILSVIWGWLLFREHGIREKLIAALVMLTGVLLIYLPIALVPSLAVGGVVAVAFIAYLAAARRPPAVRVEAA